MNRIFVDMDGVLADFASGSAAYAARHNLGKNISLKKKVGLYSDLPPMEGALPAVRVLIDKGYDIWVATKPPTGAAHAYAEKAQWVFDKLPELTRKLIITPDKGMLGDHGDYLIDDRPHKANCEQFRGKLMKFGADHEYKNWSDILKYFC